jgi:hypothetical protein
MTVHNTGYSTFEEAWGEPFLSPNLQKKKKKKQTYEDQSDPICDLYAMGNNNYNDNDIVSYANQFYDKYDKSQYQKPMMKNRERENPKMVDVRDGSVYAYGAPYAETIQLPSTSAPRPQENVETEEEVEIPQLRRPAPRQDPNVLRETQEFYMGEEDPDYYHKDSAFNMMDIILYILSGIILIFMMEQFVKIGMLLN